jgi:hypothetical protein
MTSPCPCGDRYADREGRRFHMHTVHTVCTMRGSHRKRVCLHRVWHIQCVEIEASIRRLGKGSGKVIVTGG